MPTVAEDRRYLVSGDDRSACIDLVNRHNLAFDEWDVEKLVALFTEDGRVLHPKGNIDGRNELRRFYDDYRPTTLGVRRQAVNHVVDGLAGGLVRVTSYNVLIRVGAADADREVKETLLTVHADTLPAVWIHAKTVDTCRNDDGHGWRICERRAEGNVVNGALR